MSNIKSTAGVGKMRLILVVNDITFRECYTIQDILTQYNCRLQEAKLDTKTRTLRLVMNAEEGIRVKNNSSR